MSPGTTIPRRPDEERAAQLLMDDLAAGPGSCAALWSNARMSHGGATPAAMKWWGWGEEDVFFTHEGKPELAP